MNSVPLVDLSWQHSVVDAEVRAGIDAVLHATDFIGGKAVDAFERAYADFVGVDHCIGVANGTDALEIALRAHGIGAGDEVVLPANTFVATAEAVVRAGARPVLVDCDDDYLLMDPVLVPAALTARTQAIMPVHLYGQAAPVEQIVATVGVGIAVIEDAAQSQGATRRGRPAGSLGAAAGTSFYPGKNLGAYGDAGAVVTNDADIAYRARLISNHGSNVRYQHEAFGFNSRLDTLQAVVLNAKLSRLTAWNELRRTAADRYTELLTAVDEVRTPAVMPGNEHVWHLYVVRVAHRDMVVERLREQGVGAAIHYPVPVHLQPAFANLGYERGAFPVAERTADEILTLPLYPGITMEQQEHVVTALAEAVRA